LVNIIDTQYYQHSASLDLVSRYTFCNGEMLVLSKQIVNSLFIQHNLYILEMVRCVNSAWPSGSSIRFVCNCNDV